MLGTSVLKFHYLHLPVEWLSPNTHSFSSLMKKLHYLIENNNFQNKDHISSFTASYDKVISYWPIKYVFQ